LCQKDSSAVPRLVIGRDTRASGSWLEERLVAGIEAGGGTALLAGALPTPAVALLVRELGADGGVVISASHNPPEYNGIKFFDAQGYKLSAEAEAQFEKELEADAALNAAHSGDGLPGSGGTSSSGGASRSDAATGSGETSRSDASTGSASGSSGSASGPSGSASGSSGSASGSSGSAATAIPDASERYIAHAVATVRDAGLDLVGLKVAVDCAHGAAFRATPEALRELGAEVEAINTSYDGTNINVACGSTNLGPIRRLVAQTEADIGLAHDGDADRLIAIDAEGREIDGDFIEAICAMDLKQRGLLAHNTVVSTVMCNLGFVRAMSEQGVKVLQTDVGDSNVLVAMREGGYILGGEQSGHMIFLEHNSTGDGLVTALQLLAAMRRSGQPLHELARIMRKYPQTLINIPVSDRDKAGLASSRAISAAVAEAKRRLSQTGGGRVLLRPSGTEPLVRVMVEAFDEPVAQREAKTLAELVKRELS
jgi:phosphoglucosamine mutase